MRKVISLFVCLLAVVLSVNAQSREEKLAAVGVYNTECWCHFDYHNGMPDCYHKDTIFYTFPIKIYNNTEEVKLFELHYIRKDYERDKAYALKVLNRTYDDAFLQKYYNKYSKDTISISPLDSSLYNSAKEYYQTVNYVVRGQIAEKFKYGYVDKWSWSTNSVNGIDFNITYTNTNPKTIKYIDIYFIVKNGVGDICRISYNNGSNTCHLRCVGPIKQYESGSYSWDAVYYTTGDASVLHLTKFVITYMDNTKYTLVKELAYKDYYWD